MATTYPTSQQQFSDESAITTGNYTKQNSLYDTVEALEDQVGYDGDVASDSGSHESRLKQLESIGTHSRTVVAVASAFAMPQTTNVVVTGTSPSMTSITASGADIGRVVFMHFPNATTIVSGSAIDLDSADFVGPGTLILGSDGVKWFEHARSFGDVELNFGTTATAVATASASGASGQPSDAEHVHNFNMYGSTIVAVATASGAGSSHLVSRTDHAHLFDLFGNSATAVATASGAGSSPLASKADHAHNLPNGIITNAHVDAAAAIAESKLALASDAAAGTPSRRTLGTGATQAAAGDHTHGGGAGDATSLQGEPIDVATPAEGNVLTYVSGEWAPAAPSGGSGGLPLVTLVPPAMANFSWSNQGSATGTDEFSSIRLMAPADAGNNARILRQALPGSTFIATVGIVPITPWAIQYLNFGICLIDTTGGNVQGFGFWYESGWSVRTINWTASGATFGTSANNVLFGPMFQAIFFQVEHDASNRHYRVSPNGQQWYTWASPTKTDHVTPDAVGFYAASMQTSKQLEISAIHWTNV